MKKAVTVVLLLVFLLTFASTAIAKPAITNNLANGGTLTIKFVPEDPNHMYFVVIKGIGALPIYPDGGICPGA